MTTPFGPEPIGEILAREADEAEDRADAEERGEIEPLPGQRARYKYERVAAALRGEIRAGLLKPGARLPAEADLAAQFRVTSPTLRQALTVLRAEGLVETRHGVGTFVRSPDRKERS